MAVAATKKVVLHEHFSLMMSVWVPPDSTSPAALIEQLQHASGTERVGSATVEAVSLPSAAAADAAAAAAPEVRRVLLECPQQPGIVLALTELLKDQGCDGRMRNPAPATMAWLMSSLGAAAPPPARLPTATRPHQVRPEQHGRADLRQGRRDLVPPRVHHRARGNAAGTTGRLEDGAPCARLVAPRAQPTSYAPRSAASAA